MSSYELKVYFPRAAHDAVRAHIRDRDSDRCAVYVPEQCDPGRDAFPCTFSSDDLGMLWPELQSIFEGLKSENLCLPGKNNCKITVPRASIASLDHDDGALARRFETECKVKFSVKPPAEDKRFPVGKGQDLAWLVIHYSSDSKLFPAIQRVVQHVSRRLPYDMTRDTQFWPGKTNAAFPKYLQAWASPTGKKKAGRTKWPCPQGALTG